MQNRSKRGMTAIVTVVILVALVLVAIGIVWAVVSGIFRGGADRVDIGSKCVFIDITITNATNTTLNLQEWNVTVARNTDGEEFDGIRFVFGNTEGSSDAIDKTGDIQVLDSVRYELDVTNANLDGNATMVKAAAYFLDDEGEAQVCSQGVVERAVTII